MAYPPVVLENAIFLCAASYQTYKQFSNNGEFVTPAGYRVISTIEVSVGNGKQESFGFILEGPEQIIIAFRGTEPTVFDIETDIDIVQTDFAIIPEGGRVHHGFYNIYLLFRRKLLEDLQTLPPNKNLFITGHSLGGALAVLCGLDIAVNAGHRPYVYTYAAPCVGNYKFVNRFNAAIPNSIRVFNVHDLVPIDPQIKFGNRVLVNGIYDQVNTAFPLDFQENSPVKNHSIANYFKALSQFAPLSAEAICRRNPEYCPVNLS